MVADPGRELKISRKANGFIQSLPEKERKAVKTAVEKLIAGDVQGLDIVRLLPYPKEYRLRIGRIRILFESTPQRLFIFKAEYRGSVYKK